MHELEKLAHEIISIPSRFEKDLSNWDEIVIEYSEIRRKIRYYVLDSNAGLLGIEDDHARQVVIDILNDNTLPMDRFVADILKDNKDIDVDALLGRSLIDNDPFGENASQYFHSWFDAGMYVSGMFEIGAVVLQTRLIPTYLDRYVNECRQCYAFQNYLATIVMARTMLEICISHAVHDFGRVIPETVYRSEKQSIRRNFRAIGERYPDIKKELNDLYDEMSNVAHGNLFQAPNIAGEALWIFERTLKLISRIMSEGNP